VDSEPLHTNGLSDLSSICDLRGVPLAQLARRAAAGEKDVTEVAKRIVGNRESPASVPAMMFNSTI
jgi:hypothetical protein